MDIFQENVETLKNELGRGNNSEFGRKLGGVSSQNVTNWEGGTSFPNVLTIRKFSELGVNLNWLISRKGKPFLSQENDELQKERNLRMESESREKQKDLEIEALKRKENVYLSMLEKDLNKDVNFNEAFTEDQLVDNLDNVQSLTDICLKTRLVGQAYNKDLIGNC